MLFKNAVELAMMMNVLSATAYRILHKEVCVFGNEINILSGIVLLMKKGIILIIDNQCYIVTLEF